jgi:hypothetical protein
MKLVQVGKHGDSILLWSNKQVLAAGCGSCIQSQLYSTTIM